MHCLIQRKGTTSVRQNILLAEVTTVFALLLLLLPSFSPIWPQTLLSHYHWAQGSQVCSAEELSAELNLRGSRTSLPTCTTWELYHPSPKGDESSVAAGTTAQVKGFGDITQEFAKKSSHPIPGTWGQRACAGFHLWIWRVKHAGVR